MWVESKGFWRWCTTFRITGFLDFVHRPNIQITKQNVSETGSVSVFRCSLPSAVDGNRSSFRKVVFSSYFEFRTIDKVQKPNDSESKLEWIDSGKQQKTQSGYSVMYKIKFISCNYPLTLYVRLFVTSLAGAFWISQSLKMTDQAETHLKAKL
jgi:hypothetical protein